MDGAPQSGLSVVLTKDEDGSFGVDFAESSTCGLVVQSVGHAAQAAGVRHGDNLCSLEANGMDYDATSMKLRALTSICARNRTITMVFSSTGNVLGAAPSGHDTTPVHILRGLLSAADIATIHAAAIELQRDQRIHQYDNELKGNHESLFLHERGFFRQACPDIYEKVLTAMRGLHVSGGTVLGVRCIEYHCYRTGGSLLDPEHRDVGSTLTLSALLTDPSLLEGGVFMTWKGGQPVFHDDIGMGDAIVFHSERVHNVSAVMEGVRHSLVVELWDGPDNQSDRHS